jgi:predicted nucleic acid-binding protein
MSDLVFIDTNVLIYAVDDRDKEKRDRAREWLTHCWENRCGRLSVQVLNEFYVNVRKKIDGVGAIALAKEDIRRYALWKPLPIDEAIIESAWRIETRYAFSYWDSLVVAAAQQQECALLLSEDMQDGQVLDRLKIVNPFSTGVPSKASLKEV